MLFRGPDDRPVRGTVYEVQLGRDPHKLGSWKLYVGHLETEFRIKASLVVFTPDPAVATWYLQQIAKDDRSGARLHPKFFAPADVPLIMDEEVARRDRGGRHREIARATGPRSCASGRWVGP